MPSPISLPKVVIRFTVRCREIDQVHVGVLLFMGARNRKQFATG
jgi:hypothetical protein